MGVSLMGISVFDEGREGILRVAYRIVAQWRALYSYLGEECCGGLDFIIPDVCFI